SSLERNSLESLSCAGPWSLTDFVSPTHSDHLEATLADYFPSKPSSFKDQWVSSFNVGSVVPAGYHLIYFNPKNLEHQLSNLDGYDNHQAPGGNYERRMWMGGSMEFNPTKKLIMGQSSSCMESIEKVSYLDEAETKLSVTIKRLIYNCPQKAVSIVDSDWAIKESRSLVYLTSENDDARKDLLNRFMKCPSTPAYQHTLTPSELLLFRYSALTFNAHKIHYDPEFCKTHEKLPGVVVHGPLACTLLLKWFTTKILPEGQEIIKFEYRNLVPLFSQKPLIMSCKPSRKNGVYDVWISNHKQGLAVLGKIR
ncbi:hypothetical protein NADFUDRAFT_12636, partial [Nadsonia fulvescens var. elongata DSM 6958]